MRNWVKYISDRMGKRFVLYNDIKVMAVEWNLVCFRKIYVEAINQLCPDLPPSSMNVNYIVKYLSVIRRAICLIGTKASTAAGDISSTVISSSTAPTGETFRNTDGKMVRRVKRVIIKNAAALNEATPKEKACMLSSIFYSQQPTGPVECRYHIQ